MNRKNKAALIGFSLIFILPCFNSVQASTYKWQGITQNHNPILFLHCWTGMDLDWINMKSEFEIDGWSKNLLYAYTFDYPNNCTVELNIHKANQVTQWVDTILKKTGAKKIDLVGHCLGALIGQYYIKFLGGIDTVDDYVSLAGAHHGIRDEEKRYGICGAEGSKLAYILAESDETPGGILNDTIGDRVDPIWGNIYNSTHVPGNISYTSIYSLNDSVIPYKSSILDGAINIPVVGLSHMQINQAWPEAAFKVYKLVRAAVDDLNSTFSPRTTTTTTATTITTTSVGLGSLSLIVAVLVLISWRKKKK